MTKLALIDIGSNSIRMVIYQLKNPQKVQELQRYRQFVQLAKDMTAQGAINETNFSLGIKALQHFHQIIVSQHVSTVIATATQAIRQASNQQEFIQAAQQQAQIKIVVLSGEEEATYDALAIQTDLQLADFMFLDTGGGSFELGIVTQQHVQQVGSWPYGAVKLYDELQNPSRLSSAQINTVKSRLETCLQPFSTKMVKQLVVIGGVHNTLFTVMEQPASHWIAANKVISWVDLIQHNSLAQNLTLSKMESQRAPFMPAGLLPLKAVLDYFSVEKVCFSKAGLRNGILQSYLDQDLHQ